MDRGELETILGVELAPIEPHLAALGREHRLPIADLRMCLARIEEAGPPLRALLARAAAGETLDEDEETLLFRGVHILGGARDTASFQPIMRLLRLPDDAVEYLLGDAITETLSRIVVGVFDGDAVSLFDAILDAELDEFIRDALFGAAAFLTFEGKIGRSKMEDFLARFFDDRLADEGDFVWDGWAEAVSLLGSSELAPRVREAFRLEVVLQESMTLSEFEEMFAEALAAPDDTSRFEKANLGYIEDVADSLAWVDYGPKVDGTDYGFDGGVNDPYRPIGHIPAINPWRGVGRNDPCPCGSGKKAKKCCLSGDRDPARGAL